MAYTDIDKPSDYFETKLWTGNSTDDTAITGLDFAPNWVWIKNRTDTNSHALFDTVRGATKYIESDTTDAEATGATFLKSFTSDGFVLGTGGRVNNNAKLYASWNWKAGTSFTNDASSTGIGSIDSTGSASDTSGFSIVSYTGTGSAGSIKHGLTSAPKIMITKSRSGARNWITYTTAIDGSMDYLYLNLTDAKGNSAASVPTSSIVNLTNGAEANASSENFIMYCFAEKKGYSKFGSYVGNGNADGTFIYTGFKPAFVMCKASSVGGSVGYAWSMFDNKRSSYNIERSQLEANTSDAQQTDASGDIDLLSNGFKFRNSASENNQSGATYIYMAFAENPFVTSTGVPATAR